MPSMTHSRKVSGYRIHSSFLLDSESIRRRFLSSHLQVQRTRSPSEAPPRGATWNGSHLPPTSWTHSRGTVTQAQPSNHPWRAHWQARTLSVNSSVGLPILSSASTLYSRARGTVGWYRRQCFSPSSCRMNTYREHRTPRVSESLLTGCWPSQGLNESQL